MALRHRLLPSEIQADDPRWPEGFAEVTDTSESDSLLLQQYHRYSREQELNPQVYMDEMCQMLPESWNVVSVSLNTAQDMLYIYSIGTSKKPIVLRLPLKRLDAQFGYQEVLERFRSILRSSDDVTRSGSLCTSDEDKKNWWKRRKSLDQDLKQLLCTIETQWIGAFRGIFCSRQATDKESRKKLELFMKSLQAYISDFIQRYSPSTKGIDVPQLDLGTASVLMNLGASPTEIDLKDILLYLIALCQRSGFSVSDNAVNWTAEQELLSSCFRTNLFSQDASSPLPRHTVLILDKETQMFPWESLPILRGRSVSRLPSMAFLRDRLLLLTEGLVTVDPKSLFYMLNPAGDLVRTQEKFEATLKRYDFLFRLSNVSHACDSNPHWNGIIGQVPEESTYVKALSKDIYLYVACVIVFDPCVDCYIDISGMLVANSTFVAVKSDCCRNNAPFPC